MSEKDDCLCKWCQVERCHKVHEMTVCDTCKYEMKTSFQYPCSTCTKDVSVNWVKTDNYVRRFKE